MKKCEQCGKEVSNRAKFCSDKCRMAYNRAQPEQDVRFEPEQSKPEQEPEQVLSDGQRWTPDGSARALLEQWRKGKGTPYQQALGRLNAFYGKLHCPKLYEHIKWSELR